MTNERTDSEKRSWVKNKLLDKIVKGYIVGDLMRMLDIEVIPDYDGNCNFPIALYTLTSMDFLGYLIAEEEFSLGGGATVGRIGAYIEMVFDREDKRKLKPYMKDFAERFRHGLAHEFFPKMAGISRGNPEIITWSKDGGYWVLDADRLAEMLIRSVAKLEKKLMEDDKIGLRMFDRYERMQSAIANKFKDKADTRTISLSTPSATTTTLPYEPGC